MARQATNNTLHKAKGSKSDEFYTLFEDIERELAFYKDCFYGKTIYCNCDNPKESNFFKYFFSNFKQLGLKKLIASYYTPYNTDLFNTSDFKYGGYVECTIKDLETEIPQLPIKLFNGSGDFRSQYGWGFTSEGEFRVLEFLNIMNCMVQKLTYLVMETELLHPTIVYGSRI